jgi:hypothetical protein
MPGRILFSIRSTQIKYKRVYYNNIHVYYNNIRVYYNNIHVYYNNIHVYYNNIRVYYNNIRVYYNNIHVYYNNIRVYYRANDMNGHSYGSSWLFLRIYKLECILLHNTFPSTNVFSFYIITLFSGGFRGGRAPPPPPPPLKFAKHMLYNVN